MPDDATQFAKDEQLVNSLSGLCEQIRGSTPYGPFGQTPEISTSDTLFLNLRWYLISNLRQLLSQMYVEHGIVQTLIEQPVDDGFRAGFEIKTGQLDTDEIEELKIFDQKHKAIGSVIQATKWARLFGGGAILFITDQDHATPFDLEAIGPDTPLEFRAVDMWELYYNNQNTTGSLDVGGALGANMGEFYDYYGKKVHHTRVKRIIGKEAPSFIRPRLRGWGMSEVERIVRSLNQFLKNQDVIFELLDEAKVDVYRIEGFNDSLINTAGTNKIAARIQAANMIKNFNSALTMDKGDEYEQKQITFSGLSEILLQIRQGLAADLRMPMTKLFGISAAGFNSGEDDIENYNAMIESEIRAKAKFIVVDVLQICCQKVFGFTVDDLMIEFNPLRILNAKEEEEVKDSQFARVTTGYSLGLIQAKEAKEAINKDSLLGVEIDENAEALPPIGGGQDAGDEKVKPAKGKAGKQTPGQA